METKPSFETLVPNYQDTRRHVRKQSNHQLQLYKMGNGVIPKASFCDVSRKLVFGSVSQYIGEFKEVVVFFLCVLTNLLLN
jgi:hypothetical protein